MKIYAAALSRIFLAILAIPILIVAFNFPYDSDAPLSQREIEAAQKYYSEAYQTSAAQGETQTTYETAYLRVAEKAAKDFRIEDQVQAFVDQFGLKDNSVLEIGSGRGYLQDLVKNYTGLDISPSVQRFYHKKFVLGSATALPFSDDSFDAIWSIWVFEHVPNPEQAFSEARRVTKNNGLLFFLPAWNVPAWAAEGYQVRPYADFGTFGKIIKLSIPLRSSLAFNAITLLPVRAVRTVAAGYGPTKLRYRRLTPNHEKYWGEDSDAVNSIDSHEAVLWFSSRGDKCLNCDGDPLFFPVAHKPLIIRVHKPAS